VNKETRSNGLRKQRCSNCSWRPQAATSLAETPFNPFPVPQGGHHSLIPFPISLCPSPLPFLIRLGLNVGSATKTISGKGREEFDRQR
jgi:hypothetical protein